ncbi:EspA/EspE family type VII secretion system effector [Mycolicibacterium fortuitum]|uniref:EspA/EspE family type VII secretion system effector n=1 Tax=Mycolicibacterium fortuitum TaxID=1766 RepID=UPI0026249A97|nr:EspA/EspE family type VII secretion system effector [Mycolicibacterium fortuitum]
MSVLEAFLTVSRTAQSSFGAGTPQPGTPLSESSTAVRSVETDLRGASPGGQWTGTASDAYAQANIKHIGNVGAFAELDQRLGAQIDSAADVVSNGRENVISVHNWVVRLAELVPSGPLREALLLPIVNTGIAQIGATVLRTKFDLSSISDEITEIANEYQKLGAGEGAGSTMEEDPRKKLEDILREYQVKDDRMLPKWLLDTIGGVLGDEVKGDANLTVGEYRVLAELAATQGPLAVKDFFDIKQAAIDEASRRFPPPDGNTSDNHTDAFRHTYWNALMTQRFGEE